MIEDITLRVSPETAYNEERLRNQLERSLPKSCVINDYRVVKRSIDARKKPIYVNVTVRVAVDEDRELPADIEPVTLRKVDETSPRLIIVGAGPAGLFAAIEALRQGIKPIVLERGKDVDSRRLDIARISREGRIDPVSNYCFGEGGAGAYSDGKLYTRSKKRGDVGEVLQLLVQHGAKEDIVIDAHPHIGSDKLPHIIKNIRENIIAHGGEVHFETCVTGLIAGSENDIKGVSTDIGDYLGEGVILAIGHSAHDTIRQLHKQGLGMAPKGIAVGVRLEHPQTLIDRIQYHSETGRGKWLPAAEYRMVTQVDGRGVYSFCMCPGGVIVPAGSAPGELVVNGMSASGRSGKWANSGMVVELHPGDLGESDAESPLSMLEVQEKLERDMYQAAGNSIVAPAQRMTDFIKGKVSRTLPPTSYAPGIQPMDFNKILPEFISRRLARAFEDFGRKARGFNTPEGIMIGLESRTSSPVRIVRDEEMLNSISHNNLYPAGEGAGYAGGIVSAAIDGMRCVKAFAAKYNGK